MVQVWQLSCCAYRRLKEAFNPNAVKVVMDAKGFALYFSRATIPWERDRFNLSHDEIGEHYFTSYIGIFTLIVQAFIRRYITWEPPSTEIYRNVVSSCVAVVWREKST